MDYTSIHVYGHTLSDDVLRSVEQDNTFVGNREQDFGIDTSTGSAIDYAWSSLRNDWKFFRERSTLNDPYGTRRARDFMERLLSNLGYHLERQTSFINVNGKGYDITYINPDLKDLPVTVVGDKTGEADIDTLDKCSLDYRAKGQQRKKSPHATMLEYLNSTEHVYGIVSNGQTIRLLRNSGQLVKLTYIEFDLRRMVEEDKYTEFCLLFRLLHASRFRAVGDTSCILEQWFNMSIESGNRIRAGLSAAVQKTMESIGNAVISGQGDGNDALRAAIISGEADEKILNKELIHFIYRLLFLFIIEERNLVYQIPDSPEHPDYIRLCHFQEIYKQYYTASRFRGQSELHYLKQARFHDMWEGLMETFCLFESGGFGEKIGIKPLGGVLFDYDTLHYLKHCRVSNKDFLDAFSALNEFTDENGNRVKINYSSLDVEEFGSVYEGILEMHPFVLQGSSPNDWQFGFVGGLDRQSTSSYYTRPDLVQSLIKTTLEPVIKERITKFTTPEEKVKSLLSMKVCDAASGSGHIVLAMARTIAWYVCTIRSGEDNPASLDYREALREVIQKCVYAVDYNPDAVELCKVVLWIEGYCAGKPLSFLDHHIRCGNSVIGVTDLDMLLEGVPNDAFCATDRDTLRQIKRLNTDALTIISTIHSGDGGEQLDLFSQGFSIENIDEEQIGLADQVKAIESLPEESLLEALTKQKKWENLMVSPRVECLRRACDVYTYAFYKQYKPADVEESFIDNVYSIPDIPYTRTVYHALEEIKKIESPELNFKPLSDTFKKEVETIAKEHSFFHWCVEFPEVFAGDGGFDVMCGNPPWDRIKVEDKKWFEIHGRSDIVNAGTASQRKKLIARLAETDPILFQLYCQAQQDAEAMSRFIRFSERFVLTAVGDIDLYPLFAELCLTFTREAWGLVMPSGIAINDSTKEFFAKLIDENRLISLYDFENREALFDIHRMFKFCLLTAGKAQDSPREVTGGFYLTRLDHLLDPARIYTLKTSEFAMLNPNTKTCPVFRTRKDAEITSRIYRNSSILINDKSECNPWDVRFNVMFDISTDSEVFVTRKDLEKKGAKLSGNRFISDNIEYVPLIEGKMFWLYNHHFGTWPNAENRPNAIPSPSMMELQDSQSVTYPWYWTPIERVNEKLIKRNSIGDTIWKWNHKYYICFRKISNSTNERTFITCVLRGNDAISSSSPLIYCSSSVLKQTLLLGIMSSLVFDYCVRQKVGGSNLSPFNVKQFPVLLPAQFTNSTIEIIVERIVELCYFNHDLDGWMEELWNDPEVSDSLRQQILTRLSVCNGGSFTIPEPFKYNDERRASAQAELDAIFAHLYGLPTEDLKYILDPEDVCGVGCINETFRVLKDNEIREFGEYRTKRLVMEAWDKFGFDKNN